MKKTPRGLAQRPTRNRAFPSWTKYRCSIFHLWGGFIQLWRKTSFTHPEKGLWKNPITSYTYAKIPPNTLKNFTYGGTFTCHIHSLGTQTNPLVLRYTLKYFGFDTYRFGWDILVNLTSIYFGRNTLIEMKFAPFLIGAYSFCVAFICSNSR